MENQKMENQKMEKVLLSENELEEVSGGGFGSQVRPFMRTMNSSTYSSGSVPKWHVGQTLKIEYYNITSRFDCTCVVMAVSQKANCGLIYKEFGYTVQITAAPDAVLNDGLTAIGQIYHGVYEGNLYDR